VEPNRVHEMLNPARLEFARTRRKWTKAKLAQALGVQSRSIQGYESGEYAPEPERLTLISKLLAFPEDFFFGDDLPKIAEHTASFRSMSKMSAALKESALGAGALAFVLNGWIESQFNLPVTDLPNLSDLSPEDAAATLRRMWGLGETPISNMIHLLESKGVRIYSLAIEAREVDAFSVWHNNTPFVFLNTFKSAEHSRFDVGHELGHLVRDSHSMLHGNVHSPEMEREANAFASAFLMPRNSVVALKPDLPTVHQLIELKSHFGVSLAALAYRMNQLDLLTEWTYRSLCIEIAKKGYRTKEPKPMRQETSQMLAKVFQVLRAEGIKKSDIASELCLFVEDLDNLTFGLTISSVAASGGAESSSVAKARSQELRLVK
jgi:Zn-dependent peptidase ImmA (M78 family)/transcriptional regulator with XRE-family HTH domain